MPSRSGIGLFLIRMSQFDMRNGIYSGVMVEPSPTPRSNTKGSRIWIPLVLLLISLFVFWLLPAQLGLRPVHVEFEKAGAERK